MMATEGNVWLTERCFRWLWQRVGLCCVWFRALSKWFLPNSFTILSNVLDSGVCDVTLSQRLFHIKPMWNQKKLLSDLIFKWLLHLSWMHLTLIGIILNNDLQPQAWFAMAKHFYCIFYVFHSMKSGRYACLHLLTMCVQTSGAPSKEVEKVKCGFEFNSPVVLRWKR